MITIREYTKSPLTHMGSVAAYCYGMEDKVSRFKNIAKRCLKENHGRVSEFATIEMEIDGYSAKVIRELYTHIAGTSRLQASTRYIDYSKQFEYITPKSIRENIEALEIWDNLMHDISSAMIKLKNFGIPVEDFTNALPLAYGTKMILKINVRSLVNMFNVRLCTCAYHEYRDLMIEMKKKIMELNDEEWTFLAQNYFVPKCIPSGYCEEETRNCGIRPKKSDIEQKLSMINHLSNEELANLLMWRQ